MLWFATHCTWSRKGNFMRFSFIRVTSCFKQPQHDQYNSRHTLGTKYNNNFLSFVPHFPLNVFIPPALPPEIWPNFSLWSWPRSAGSLLTNRILYLQCHTFKTSSEKPILSEDQKMTGGTPKVRSDKSLTLSTFDI